MWLWSALGGNELCMPTLGTLWKQRQLPWMGHCRSTRATSHTREPSVYMPLCFPRSMCQLWGHGCNLEQGKREPNLCMPMQSFLHKKPSVQECIFSTVITNYWFPSPSLDFKGGREAMRMGKTILAYKCVKMATNYGKNKIKAISSWTGCWHSHKSFSVKLLLGLTVSVANIQGRFLRLAHLYHTILLWKRFVKIVWSLKGMDLAVSDSAWACQVEPSPPFYSLIIN